MNSNLKNYSLLLIACIIWGLTPLCGRILKDCMSPMLITGLRFSIASSIIFIVLAFTEGKKAFMPSKHDFIVLLAMAFLGIFLHNCMLFKALQITTASNASLIESVGPSITSVLAFFIIGERLSKIGWLGIFISCFGAIFIVTKGSIEAVLNLDLNIGDVIVVICEAMWSFYVVISWKLSGKLSPLSVTAWTCFIGAAFCIVVGTVTGALEVYAITPYYIGAFLALTLLAGVVAFATWNMAIGKVGASKGGTFVYLIPIFGVVFGVTILGESFSYKEVIGAVIVIIGMIFSAKAKLSVKELKPKISDIKKEILEKQQNSETN